MLGVLEGGDEVDHPGILLAGLELGHHFLFSFHARHLDGTITTHDIVSSPVVICNGRRQVVRTSFLLMNTDFFIRLSATTSPLSLWRQRNTSP
jgi:hypothetical protein